MPRLAFDCVRCRFAPRIFLVAVVDGLMVGKVRSNGLVVLSLVGIQRAIENDVLSDHGLKGRLRQILDLDGYRPAAALDHRQNLALDRRASLALPSFAVDKTLVGLADERLINFDRLSFAA
jgi:hypothetical protein